MVGLFKVVIITVLALPWMAAAFFGISFVHQLGADTTAADAQSHNEDAMRNALDRVNQLEAELATAQDLNASLEASLTAAGSNAGTHGLGAGTATGSSTTVVSSGNGRTHPRDPEAEKLALEVIVGNWGNGHTRILKLQEAGHDDRAVQALVNEIIWNK